MCVSDEQMRAERVKEELSQINPDALLADGFDHALVAYVQTKGRPTVALYDYDACVRILMERDDMEREEAEEFMEFNVVDAYVGEHTPSFAHF